MEANWLDGSLVWEEMGWDGVGGCLQMVEVTLVTLFTLVLTLSGNLEVKKIISRMSGV